MQSHVEVLSCNENCREMHLLQLSVVAQTELSYPGEPPAVPHRSGIISPLELTGRHVVAIGDKVVGGCCK